MEKNIQTWNQQAAEGGYHYRLDPVEKAVDDHLNDLLQKIFPYEEFKGKKVLDVGCGTGDFSLILILYGVIPTFQPASFGRTYAAYGGIFIVLSILWGWQIDKTAPDRFDIFGGLIALCGVCVIMYWPRH